MVVASNNLVGTIVTEMGWLSDLNRLDLSQNQLSGTIPTEVAGLTQLTYLSLCKFCLCPVPLSTCVTSPSVTG